MSSTSRFIFSVLLCFAPALASAQTISDSAGRNVEVPDTIGKVFAAGPPAAILLYKLAKRPEVFRPPRVRFRRDITALAA